MSFSKFALIVSVIRRFFSKFAELDLEHRHTFSKFVVTAAVIDEYFSEISAGGVSPARV